MSRRKQVSADILTDVPTLEEGQKFAKVLGPRGKNIHEVQYSDGEEVLVNLPPKFRNLVWDGIWPFDDQASSGQRQDSDDASSDGEDSDDSLFVNTNRPVLEETESESESDDDDDEEEEGEEEQEQAGETKPSS
ncbi:hypothetical protein BGW42_005514 [Actinomortierella wolfii]|nr:hypothetical protein BGW42_005514 [Actinomortierella wolfii]